MRSIQYTAQYMGMLCLFLISIAATAPQVDTDKANKNNKFCQLNATFDYQIEDLQVRFTNTSSGNYDKIVWKFGDEQSSQKASPTHQYDKEGLYEFCLQISNSKKRCSDTFCGKIYVFGVNK